MPDQTADHAANLGPAAGATGTSDESGVVDVVVLAGGTGRRLGGAVKPDVVARGTRLLDHVLAGLEQLRDRGLPLGHVCVVAPAAVDLPTGVLRALEDPPLGGPVAGIAAGLARLAESSGSSGSPGSPGRAAPAAHAARAAAPAELTAVVTCDAPESGRGLPALVAAAGSAQNADGACALDGDHVQYLLGVYRTAALTQCVAPGGAALRDISVRRALGGLSVVHVDLGELRSAARDLDTWEDVRAWDRH